MIWLEPLEHIDQGIFIFGIFQFFFLLNWYVLWVDINCCHFHIDKTQVPFLILLGLFSKFPARTPPSYVNVSPDISVENSASVWIFGSLLTNSQSRPKSDGTRNFAQGGK